MREQRQRDRLVSGLAERGVTVRAVDREHIKPGQPVAMTMHRAKGTEFSRVLLFGIDQGAIPRPLRDEQYAEDAWADALLRERSLLYVAATRARDELALSWSGDPSQLLPADRAVVSASRCCGRSRRNWTARIHRSAASLMSGSRAGCATCSAATGRPRRRSSCLPPTERRPIPAPSGTAADWLLRFMLNPRPSLTARGHGRGLVRASFRHG